MSQSQAKPKRLLFIGGSTDSRKGAVIQEVVRRLNTHLLRGRAVGGGRGTAGYSTAFYPRNRAGDENDESVRILRVSEHLAKATAGRSAGSLRSEQLQSYIDSISLYDWKRFEQEATDTIVNEIIGEPCLGDIYILNCHYGAYSPGGYMMGLEPSSLETICRIIYPSISALDESIHVGVMLIEAPIEEILRHRRTEVLNSKALAAANHPAEQAWVPVGVPYSVQSLLDDLQANRLYSYSYYHTLCGLLGSQRVRHQRVVHGAEGIDVCAHGVFEILKDDWHWL